jgi:hypothetical protein
MWDLSGQRVEVRVDGMPLAGTVESSRVKYGGQVQHTVRLHRPTMRRWRSEPVDVVLAAPDAIKVM